MRAIANEFYGSPEVLQIKNIDTPQPKINELLVNVKASTVTAGVVLVRSGMHPNSKLFTIAIRLMFGINKPKNQILGYEYSGVVEQVGKDVTLFKKGDKVFGTTTGLKQGSYAEYVCIPEKWKQGVVALMPDNLTFEEAAAVPIGAMTAVQILKKANIQKGNRVLVYGASGSVGTYAVQLANYYKAEITGVCSTGNIELVKSIGAKNVIDYTKEDFTKAMQQFDVVFDAVGKISNSVCKNIMKKDGRFLSVKSLTSEKTDDLNFISELVMSGQIKSVIDKIYSFEDIVEAHKYVDKGHKKGNVVIKIS